MFHLLIDFGRKNSAALDLVFGIREYFYEKLD